MLAVAICEDELYFADRLRRSLDQYFCVRNTEIDISVFANAESLLSEERGFDLILMDLKLPGMDGMEAVTRLRGKNQAGQVIFITNYQEYAVRAFEVDAVHYLLKPVSDETLFRALDRAAERITGNDRKTLTISKGNETRVILQRDILYCEVIDHKVYIHLSGISYHFFGTLENLQKQLDDRFFRCHKSYLVNLAHVVGHQGDTVTLSGGGQAFVSRRKQREFAHALLHFVRKELLE